MAAVQRQQRRARVAPRFGAWIKLLRGFAKMEQQLVAERACIPIGQIRALERGENVGVSYVQAVIAVFFGRTTEGEFSKLAGALDHELFRQMAVDGKDQIAAAELARASGNNTSSSTATDRAVAAEISSMRRAEVVKSQPPTATPSKKTLRRDTPRQK